MNRWLGIFNIIAYLLAALEEQVEILSILGAEHEGEKLRCNRKKNLEQSSLLLQYKIPKITIILQ